jgi:hypothetical protein
MIFPFTFFKICGMVLFIPLIEGYEYVYVKEDYFPCNFGIFGFRYYTSFKWVLR